MFSSFNTRDRLRRSISTRSMRKAHRVPETEPVIPEIAKIHAAAAASHAMRSSERSSTGSMTPYDRLGGPAHVAVPRRRPDSGLQFTDDAASVYSGSGVPPVTPRHSIERPGTAQARRFVDAAALPPTTDLRGLDGRDSSLPSSYRRLRKAKSMFSTRQRSHLGFGGSPKLPHDSYDADRSPGFELPRTLRPSISFIRGNNRNGAKTVRHAKSQDAAIQLARNQFLEEANATQPRRSSFFTSRRNREHKPFRKTFRMTSGTGIGGESPEQPVSKRSRSKSRTFSASIKHGLKRVFGLIKPVEQQSEMNSADSHSNAPSSPVFDYQRANNQGDHGAEMQIFDNPPLPATQTLPGRDSPCTTASRVTSWADSTAANTIVTRKTGHRQALSLIEEHGDLNQQLPQVPIGTAIDSQPSPRQRTSTRRFDDVVNSHDLYTVLMQQIGRNAARSPDEGIHYGTVAEHRVIPERTSSVYSHRSKYSIRHVASGESTPVSFATAHRGDSQSPQRPPQPNRRTESTKTSRTFRPDHTQLVGRHSAKPSRSGYIIDEESDESTGSVVFARHDVSSHRSISPSIYSRTTSGRTPTETSDSEDDAPTTYGEPGTATIFASERHSSPTRTLGSGTPKAQMQPSADWQKWMDSQIERIENVSPTREHLREDAQLQVDDDEIFMGRMRRARPRGTESTAVPYVIVRDECDEVQPSAEMKVLTQDNFSRPFSRSSSVRTILPLQKTERGTTSKTDTGAAANLAENVPPLPALSPMRVRNSDTTSKPSERSDAGFVDLVENAPPLPARSPMRIRTANLPGPPDSPTPQRNGTEPQKRMWTEEQHKRLSVRRPITNGRQNQFRSMRKYRDIRPLNKENARHEELDQMMDDYHRLEGFQTSVSSKHMVEMFLNSRRRPAETNMADDNADEAFL